MPKTIDKDYRTILRHLQTLEKNGLIELSRTEPAQKGGKDRKVYTLTMGGVVCILGYEHTYDYIGQVAANYRSAFPLIFGKWQFFIENDCVDIAIERLKDTIYLTYKYVGVSLPRLLSQEYLGRLERIKPEFERKVGFTPTDVVDDITKHFLLFPLVTSFSYPLVIFPADLKGPFHPIGKKWMSMLHKEEQLREYVHDKLVRAHKEKKRALEALTSWLNYWKI